MKIIHAPSTVLGEMFYDPATREGICISDEGAIGVTMDANFDAMGQKNARALELADARVFRRFYAAALAKSSAERSIRDELWEQLGR